ncbi:MAG: SDR family NAD(P)-dependent oxidoreductase, partial [Gammaproteobacteria bacterium]
ADVMLVGRSQDKLAETRERLGHTDKVATFATDAADDAGVRDSVAAAVEAFGGLDILFANAGTEGHVKPLTDLTTDDFDQVLRTNVVGPWLMIKHAVGALTERGGGAVIVTSSIAGAAGFPGLSAYVASKHAVNGLVKTAALELAPAKIRVNAIAPGMIDNRMLHSIAGQIDADHPDAVLEGVMPQIALQRLGRSEEIAELAVFLGSDESSYCTGSVHLMDGGYLAA